MPRNNIKVRLKEPIMDEHVRASVAAVEAFDPETGHYGTLHYVGCPTKERAAEIKQGLFRAAKRIGVSMSATVVKAGDGTWTVEFRAIDKAKAREHVLAKYGSDRSKWPYDPRARGSE